MWRLYRIIDFFKYLPKEIKWFCQRGKRGYSDMDVYGIDDWFLTVIVPMLRQLKETKHGWSLQDVTWYYYKDGILLTNTWITSGGQYYYLGEDGSMQTNTWIGNYYVDSNGVWLTNYQPAKWMQTNGKWWYRNENGSYPANTWKEINNNWYYFDSAGYLITNDWKKVGESWYYFDGNGYMVTNCYVKALGENLYYWISEDGVWDENETTATPNRAKYLVY